MLCANFHACNLEPLTLIEHRINYMQHPYISANIFKIFNFSERANKAGQKCTLVHLCAFMCIYAFKSIYVNVIVNPVHKLFQLARSIAAALQ